MYLLQRLVHPFVLGTFANRFAYNAYRIGGEITEITDNRMAKFGHEILEAYIRYLSDGSGFDDEHKRLLRKLQIE